MKARIALAALAALALTPAFAADEQVQSSTAHRPDGSNELESMVAELSIAMKMKVLFYVETNDKIVWLRVIGQPTGFGERILYDQGDRFVAIQQAFIEEAKLRPAGTNPSLLIFADNGVITVRRAESPKPFSDYPQRLNAEVNRFLPETPA